MALKFNGIEVGNVTFNGTSLDKVIYNGTVVFSSWKSIAWKKVLAYGHATNGDYCEGTYTATEDCLLVLAYSYHSATPTITCSSTLLCNLTSTVSSHSNVIRIYSMKKNETCKCSLYSGTSGNFKGFVMTKGLPIKTIKSYEKVLEGAKGTTKSYTATEDCVIAIVRGYYDVSVTITTSATNLYSGATTNSNRYVAVDIYYLNKGGTIQVTSASNSNSNAHGSFMGIKLT